MVSEWLMIQFNQVFKPSNNIWYFAFPKANPKLYLLHLKLYVRFPRGPQKRSQRIFYLAKKKKKDLKKRLGFFNMLNCLGITVK